MDVYGEIKNAVEKLPEVSTSAGGVERRCEELKAENSRYRTDLMNAMDVLAEIREDYQEKAKMLTDFLINLSQKTGTPFPKERSNLTMPSFPSITPREGQPTSEDTPNTANCDPEFCDEEGGNTPTQCTTTPILQRSAIHSTHCLQPFVKTTAPHGATFAPQGVPSTPHGTTPFHYGTPPTHHRTTPTHHKTTPTLYGAKHPLMKTTSHHGDSSIPHQLMQTTSCCGGTPVLKDIAHPLKKATSHRGITPTRNGTTPICNGTTPTRNGTTPTHNRATPTHNGITPTRRGTTPTPNGTTPTPQDVLPISQSGKNSRSDHRRKQSQIRDPSSFLPEIVAVYSQKSPLLKDSKQSYLPKLPKRKTM